MYVFCVLFLHNVGFRCIVFSSVCAVAGSRRPSETALVNIYCMVARLCNPYVDHTTDTNFAGAVLR